MCYRNTTQRYNPEDHDRKHYCRENLKSLTLRCIACFTPVQNNQRLTEERYELSSRCMIRMLWDYAVREIRLDTAA
jgi:hypothetical protein